MKRGDKAETREGIYGQQPPKKKDGDGGGVKERTKSLTGRVKRHYAEQLIDGETKNGSPPSGTNVNRGRSDETKGGGFSEVSRRVHDIGEPGSGPMKQGGLPQNKGEH